MATVKYFAGFNNLNEWPGNLFENREGDSTLTKKTATTLTITHGPLHPFAGFTVSFTGTGLAYDGNDVVDGVISSVIIKNASNQNVLQITGLSSSSIASEITALLPMIMGWIEPNGSNGGQANSVWSQLMIDDDTITGTSGDDRSLAGVDMGDDTYNMNDGNDYIGGGVGNDTYNGGDGWDTLSFQETNFNAGMAATRGVNINMVTGVVLDAWGGTDTINSIESVQGSRFKDVILGNSDDNDLAGGRGADNINGGGGRDWVLYNDDVWQGGTRGVNANLSTGFIFDGFGTRDTVDNVENVAGTRFNDTFVGNGGKNFFAGGEGVDSYDGRGNVDDSGEGDFIVFGWTFTEQEQGGVKVNLALASGQIIDDGFGNVESCVNIEGAIGSNNNDTLRGNSGKNLFAGHDGKDTMTGGGNTDEFIWWDINHFDDGDTITDFNEGQDKLSFEQGNFNNMNSIIIENDTSAETTNGTFLFNASTQLLIWDENGSEAGGRFTVVKLTGVTSLSEANFELY